MGQIEGGRRSFQEAGRDGRTGVIAEFLDYLRESKKWWMLPILIVMLCLGMLALLTSSPIAPFIYTIF